MGIFMKEMTFDETAPDLSDLQQELLCHFQSRGFQATVETSQKTHVCMKFTRGGLFSEYMGQKLGFSVDVTTLPNQTRAKTGVDLLTQAKSSYISLLVFWPMALSQAVGIARAAGLDDEAMSIIGNYYRRRISRPTEVPSSPP